MAGLMPRGMDPQEDERVGDDEGAEASPEEQAAYDEFVTAGMELLYRGGEVLPSIPKMLDEDPSDLMEVLGDVPELKEFTPLVALSATAVVVVLQVVRSMEEKPGGDIILNGGKELFEQIVEIADAQREKNGQPEITEQEMNRAWFMAMDLYREAAKAEGLIDEDALKADFEEIKAEDQAAAAEEAQGGMMPQEESDELRG